MAFRGSKGGMPRKMGSPVLETRYGGVEGHQPLRIRKRNRSGPYRESEGSIVPFEGAGQQPGPREGTLLCSRNQRVEDEEIAEMLPTPESIRTLQRKLYLKAKQEPARRFHSLYDKIHRADIHGHAYNLVRANRGSVGIDGVTFKDVEEKEGKTAFLAELCEALKDKTYKPAPVKRVMIPKANGSQRPLGIPTIRDRVAQMAAK